MCIRDSRISSSGLAEVSCAALASVSAAARETNCAAAWAGSSACSVRRAASVSYTHLRAHETVLDIVCRLLLEKKNNNQKHKQQKQQHISITTPYTITHKSPIAPDANEFTNTSSMHTASLQYTHR